MSACAAVSFVTRNLERPDRLEPFQSLAGDTVLVMSSEDSDNSRMTRDAGRQLTFAAMEVELPLDYAAKSSFRPRRLHSL